jgi:hypothetical protein
MRNIRMLEREIFPIMKNMLEVNDNSYGNGSFTIKCQIGRQCKIFLNICSLFFIIAAGIIFSSCNKDESVMVLENQMSSAKACKNSFFNPIPEYFVLPDDMLPYQYAIYEDDLPMLSEYMQSVFNNYEEGIEKEHFILSLDALKALYYYGYIVESNSYYDPNIVIYPDDNNGGGMCFTIISKTFDDFKSGWAYLMGQVKEGYQVLMTKDRKTGEYIVSYDDGK